MAFVSVVPESEFLQEEEAQHTQGYGETHALHRARPRAPDGFRQEIQEGCAQ